MNVDENTENKVVMGFEKEYKDARARILELEAAAELQKKELSRVRTELYRVRKKDGIESMPKSSTVMESVPETGVQSSTADNVAEKSVVVAEKSSNVRESVPYTDHVHEEIEALKKELAALRPAPAPREVKEHNWKPYQAYCTDSSCSAENEHAKDTKCKDCNSFTGPAEYAGKLGRCPNCGKTPPSILPLTAEAIETAKKMIAAAPELQKK